tara:strand:- start:9433 stop:9870 length:438 start_codon:yes stop_codon:yes gene_type:complete
MKAYPRGDYSSTLDISNHIFVEQELLKRHDSKGWRIVWEDQCDWIQADEGTEAEKFILQMQKAEQDYPVLNERHYSDLQYGEMLKAIKRKAEQSGTIVISYDDAHDCLLDSGIDIEECPPRYTVLCSDEVFRDTIESVFPNWKDY